MLRIVPETGQKPPAKSFATAVAAIAQQGREIQEEEATITQLEKAMKSIVTCLYQQAPQIQKVNARLEVHKAAPQWSPPSIKPRDPLAAAVSNRASRAESSRRRTNSKHGLSGLLI
jgi:hypothetical protein